MVVAQPMSAEGISNAKTAWKPFLRMRASFHEHVQSVERVVTSPRDVAFRCCAGVLVQWPRPARTRSRSALRKTRRRPGATDRGNQMVACRLEGCVAPWSGGESEPPTVTA